MRYKYLLLFLIVLLGTVLRTYSVTTNPPGLYIDEVANGVDAYSILTTGRDMHNKTYPLFFESFGDYKMPLFIYTTSLAMFFVGKNELAVRLPSILAGILSLLLFYLILRQLFRLDKIKVDTKKQEIIPLLGTFLLAITPWHIQFSRGGFEANLALFFYLLVIFYGFKTWYTKRVSYFALTLIFLLMTMYTYHSYRLIAPATFILLVIFFAYKKTVPRNILGVLAVSFILFSIPLGLFSLTPQGAARFNQTTALSEYSVHSSSDYLRIAIPVYIKNYFSFFSLDFFFSFGDGNGRHQLHDFGVLYHWELPFLILGIFYILKSKYKYARYLVFILFILSPVAASLTRPSPHTLRALLMVIPVTTLIAFGAFSVFEKMNSIKLFLLLVTLSLGIYEGGLYLHTYYVQYPIINSIDWGGKNKEIIQKATSYSQSYNKIVIDPNLGTPELYFTFYNPTLHPLYVGESWVKPQDWENKKILYIRPYYGPTTGLNKIDTIYFNNPNKDVAAEFFEL